MTNWIKCTTMDGIEMRLNAAHVAFIRPYGSERGLTGSEVVFATGTPSSITVKESQEQLTAVKKD